MGHLTKLDLNSDPHDPSCCTTTGGAISGQGAAGASLGPRALFREPGDVTADRCYVCSFCRRDFRSAQALGGHMNVHRRERALCAQLMGMRSQQGPKSGLPEEATAAWDMSNTGAEFDCGSSSSSCSPPSLDALVSASLASPWKLPPPFQNPRDRRDSVDLELRLGLSPKK